MELVANVWPVVDYGTGLVIRFFLRAYAMNAPDEVISSTLRALAPSDFRMAKTYRIPERFEVVSEHGTMRGCVSIEHFERYEGDILAPAFRDAEDSFSKLQGIASETLSGELKGVGLMPRFAPNPYLVTTPLLEYPDGRLGPYQG